MDTPEPAGLQSALFKWINTFDKPQEITSWRDLQDGRMLWSVLSQVQPDYFEGQLPEPSASISDNWIPRWQNLKHVSKAVSAFIREECGRLPEITKRMTPDLKAIAIDASAEDSTQVGPCTTPTRDFTDLILQLLQAVLLAAMFSPITNARMVEIMQELGPEVAIPIATWIGYLEQAERKLADAEGHMDTDSDAGTMASPARSGTPQTSGFTRDLELEHEEQLIKAYRNISQLQEKNQTASLELEESRAHAQKLEDELTEIKYQLEQGGQSSASKQYLEQIQQESAREKDHIAGLEQELSWYKSQTESQEQQLNRIKAQSSSQQRLKDELQMLKVERDDLMQKSKAAENLKKKIQTLQESDKTNLTLRQDYEAIEQEVRKLRPFKDRCAGLQRAAEESIKTVSNVEQQLYEASQTRRRLDSELKSVASKLAAERDRQQKDAHTIREQEERIRDLESDGAAESQPVKDLDNELLTNDKSMNDLKNRLAQIEMENRSLKDARDAANKDTLNQEAQQSLQARCDKIEKQYLQMYQDNLGLDAALKEEGRDTAKYVDLSPFQVVPTNLNSSHPYIALRKDFETVSAELETMKQSVNETETILANIRAQKEAAQSKLNAFDKDRAEALDELKRANTTGTEILQSENSRLVQHARRLQNDIEEKRSLLRHSLLNKAALAMEDTELRTKQEFNLVLEQLQAVQSDPKRMEEIAMTLTHRIEESRADSAKAAAKIAEVRSSTEIFLNTSIHSIDSISSTWTNVDIRRESEKPALSYKGDTGKKGGRFSIASWLPSKKSTGTQSGHLRHSSWYQG
ncbi:MAG: hypothetical protein M1828_003590 [Chrysothrix sp. TS-e1954]|nr:MAG: hypothetical protein M1828_003590 [Chrysothrix sp. TS-e1954]